MRKALESGSRRGEARLQVSVWLWPLLVIGSWSPNIAAFLVIGLVRVSSSVVFAWLVNGTGGSTAIASLYHFLMNAGMNVVLLFGAPAPKLYAAFAILFTILAAALSPFMTTRRRAASTA